MVNWNCVEVWKSLQILFPWLSEHFAFSLNLFENKPKLQKGLAFSIKKLKTLNEYCSASIGITFIANFVLDAKVQNRDSLEISLIFSNQLRQLVKQLVYWPFGDNNLFPFHLWWTEIVIKCEKECKYVFHYCRYSMIVSVTSVHYRKSKMFETTFKQLVYSNS